MGNHHFQWSNLTNALMNLDWNILEPPTSYQYEPVLWMLWLWKMIAAWKQLCRRFWYAWRRFSTICHVLGWHCSWEPNLLAQLYPSYVVCENDLQKAGTNYILHNDRIWRIVMWSPEPGAERCWRTKGPAWLRMVVSGWYFMVKPDLVFRGRADNLKRFLGESWSKMSKIPGTGLWIPPQLICSKTLLKSNSWIPQIGCHPAMFYEGDIWYIYICSKAHQTIIFCYLC